MRLVFAKVLTCGLAAAGLLACPGAAPVPPPEHEKTPVMPSEEPAAPAPSPDLRPASRGDVNEAMRRVFGDLPAEAYEAGQALVGDFNGDGSADLAVLAQVVAAFRPDAKTGLANWIIQDPAAAPPRDPHPSPVPVALVLGEPLFAVIHGYGPEGWRNAGARQAFVLLRREARLLRVVSRARALSLADPARLRARLEGDVLVTGDGRRFLYWTGAGYALH